MSQDRKTVYIVDAHNFLHRNYHALPKLSNSQGLEVGALYGFARWLLKLKQDKNAQYAAVCFDSAGGSTKRKALFADYKAHRKKPDDALITQLGLARELVEKMGFKVYAESGIEADDIIGYVAKQTEAENGDAVIATSDKDSYQLLNEHIKLWPQGSAKEPLRGPEYVKEKFGVEQKYLTDYLAIVGDSSDNVPGIAGLGPKTAADLINTFGSLENIIASAEENNPQIKPAAQKKILASKDVALLSKELVTLDETLTIPFKIEDTAVTAPDAKVLADLFAKYEFKNMQAAFGPGIPAPAPQQKDDGVLFASMPDSEPLESVAAKIKESMFIQTEENYVIIGADDKTFSLKDLDSLSDVELKLIDKLCQDKNILKISYDMKFTLRAIGIMPDGIINCFDLRLAAYCMDPGADISFKNLCARFLDANIEPEGEAQFLIAQNNFAWSLKNILTEDLKEADQYKVYTEMEMPLASVLLSMEELGVLVDVPWLERFSKTLESEILVTQTDINKLAGKEINVNSPKQLGVLLFEQFNLPSIKKTKTGYSTDEESLQQLINLHPIVPKILEYRANAKLKSTYVDNLIALADEHSRVHTYLDQTGTVTGRLSSSSPNLQNIPIRTPKGRMLRRAFSADPGNVLLSVDYSQIDLRLLAHESQDPVLVNALREGAIFTPKQRPRFLA
ncbi:DNA polymerase-1 [Elusimicrobium simillimum]